MHSHVRWLGLNETNGGGETSQRSRETMVMIVCHWTVVVCYYDGCVPLAMIVCHWTVIVCYYGGFVPLAVTVCHWIVIVCYYGACVPLAVTMCNWTVVVLLSPISRDN
jgi:hypothetical protein